MTTQQDLTNAIRHELNAFVPDFCESVLNAVDILGIKSYHIQEVKAYHSGGNYWQLYMLIIDNRIISFHYQDRYIIMHDNPNGLNITDWLECEETEEPINPMTDLDSPDRYFFS